MTVAAPTTFTVDDVRERWRCRYEPNFAVEILRDFTERGFVVVVAPGEYAVTALGSQWSRLLNVLAEEVGDL
jgi:predicted transcriptional regulator of viral defense system